MTRNQRQLAPERSLGTLMCPCKATNAYNDTLVRSMTSPTALQPAATPVPVSSPPRYLSVKKMALFYSYIHTEVALRHSIWQAEAYEKVPKSGLKSNGILSVIVRPPAQRKVLLDRVEFEKWLTSQQRNAR